MAVLKFQQARETVIRQVTTQMGAPGGALPTETAGLGESLERVLAEPVHADRDLLPVTWTSAAERPISQG